MKPKKEKTANTITNANDNKITYQKLFWLFIVGSLLGVCIEGVWCLVMYGQWETHVVSIWGSFCIIYGMGAAGFYAGSVAMRGKNIVTRFLVFAAIATLVEFICAWVLEEGLNMSAWDYSSHVLNISGYVSLQMSLIWGVLGIAFQYAVPFLDRTFNKMNSKPWKIACACLSIFMAVNLFATGMCIVRWKNRHEGVPASNRIEEMIDTTYDDATMEKRFIEWRFIEN